MNEAFRVLLAAIALVGTTWGALAWWAYRRNVLHALHDMLEELRMIRGMFDQDGQPVLEPEEEAPDPNP